MASNPCDPSAGRISPFLKRAAKLRAAAEMTSPHRGDGQLVLQKIDEGWEAVSGQIIPGALREPELGLNLLTQASPQRVRVLLDWVHVFHV